MDPVTLKAFQELDLVNLVSREEIVPVTPIASISAATPPEWTIALSGADVSKVVPGHFVATYGNQDGYRLIDAVGASSVLVSDTAMTATGAVGEAAVYRMRQAAVLDGIVTDQVWPWIQAKTRLSYNGTTQVREIYSGTGTSEMLLDRRWVNTVDKIELLTLPHDILSIPISSIEVIKERGALRVRAINLESFTTLAPIWPKGDNNIAITYTYGFATPPAEVSKAAALLACSFFLAKEANVTGGGASLSVEGWSRGWGKRGKFAEMRTDYAHQAMQLLKRYMTGVTSR